MKKETDQKESDSKPNIYPNRETWLETATGKLRKYFSDNGYTLPENIRFAIAFTSGGKRGMEGECWHAQLSADKHFEIIIKADNDDPVQVLGILVHELVHTLLPLSVKHGKEFRDIALKIGLEGKMAHPELTPRLKQHLETIAKSLGHLPHATFNFLGNAEKRKKGGARYLKLECKAIGCGYTLRGIAKWLKAAIPPCPINPEHGLLHCEIPEDDGDGDSTPDNHGDNILPDAVIVKNETATILPQQQSPRSLNPYEALQQKLDG